MFAQSSKRVTLKIQTTNRPTSITAVLFKVFEKVIREQNTNSIDNNKLFPRYNLVSGKINPRRIHWFSQLENKEKKLITIILLLLFFYLSIRSLRLYFP